VRLDVAAALVEGKLVPGGIEVVDGCVAAYGLNGNGGGSGIAAPGFVDLQVNGFAGVDFLDADGDGYRRAGEALLETGVTSYVPTLITAPEETLVAALAEVPDPDADTASGARVLGVHLEGPFLSEWRLGTHPPAGRRDPDLALLERLLSAGPVRAMTLAPELPGALDLVDVLVARDVVVSCGHTDASAEEADLAFDRGARTVTHLFNAMRPFMHRDPGIAGAALARDDVIVQIIVDGIHLAPETTELVWKAAAGRVALVTDSVAAAGVGDGSYSLGPVALSIDDGAVRGPDGILAGSVLTMIEAVRNLHALGAPLERVLEAASTVPARVLGLADVGRIAVGTPADLVVLDDNLEVESVFMRGEARVVA
jgi:N-acetylglucosamine-6-phosphate deacetylase